MKELMKSLENFALSQLRASTYAWEVLVQLAKKGVLTDKGLNFFPGLNADQLARMLCSPTAISTVINALYRKRLVGDAEGEIRVGDFYRLMIPFHALPVSKHPQAPYDKGWWVVTQGGDVYHQAAIAFAEAFDINGISIFGFKGIERAYQELRNNENVLLTLSLRSNFVEEVTLKGQPSGIKEGTHLVVVFSLGEDKAVISDPFHDPLEKKPRLVFEVPIKTLMAYLNYPTKKPPKGMLFSLEKINFPLEYITSIVIPEQVRKSLKANSLFKKARKLRR